MKQWIFHRSCFSVQQIEKILLRLLRMNLLLLRMGKCRHHLISRDLIWIKIVVWNYLQTKSVIVSAIRFVVFINCISIEITIQLNSKIGCFRWSPNPRLKHLLSNHGPRDVIMQQQRHKWLCDVMNVMHSNRCPRKVGLPPRPLKNRAWRRTREQYIYKLCKTNEHSFWNFELSSRMSSRVYINVVTIFCSHF